MIYETLIDLPSLEKVSLWSCLGKKLRIELQGQEEIQKRLREIIDGLGNAKKKPSWKKKFRNFWCCFGKKSALKN